MSVLVVTLLNKVIFTVLVIVLDDIMNPLEPGLRAIAIYAVRIICIVCIVAERASNVE